MGKLILAIQRERDEAIDAPDAARTRKVLDRAHTLLQASQSSSASNFLDGRSVAEYLDPAWVEEHPSVKPSIEAFVVALNESESA